MENNRKNHEERNNAIFEDYSSGKHPREIAKDFGITAQRVWQIVGQMKRLGGRYYRAQKIRRVLPAGTRSGRLQSMYVCECVICGAVVSSLPGTTRTEAEGDMWQLGWQYKHSRWHCADHDEIQIEGWWWEDCDT